MKYNHPKLELDKSVEPVIIPERLEIGELNLDPDGKIYKMLKEIDDYKEKTKNISVGEY